MRYPYPDNRGSSWLVRSASWLDDHWPQFIQIIGGALIGAVSVVVSTDSGDLGIESWWSRALTLSFILSIALLLVGGIVSISRSEGLSNLQRDVQRRESELEQAQQQFYSLIEDYYQLFNYQLYLLSTRFLRFTDHERVSVYSHDGRAFIMLGRYSEDPEFKKPGRQVYPDDQGCIREAWRNGFAFEPSLPDPEQDEEKYLTELERKWAIPRDVGGRLRMKSQSFAAFSIKNERGDRVAVIVFESLRTGVLNFNELDKLIAGPEGTRLREFIETTKHLQPSPTYARQEGF